MKKADYKFHRDRKEQIESQSRQSEVFIWRTSGSPIFIPKRKKKK